MKVILNEELDNLGSIGSIVNVKNGYARNYLFPKKLAVLANEGNRKQFEHQKRLMELKRAKSLKEFQTLKGNLEKIVVEITKQVGEEGKIFGSVTSHEVSEFIDSKGFSVSKKKILFADEIKSTGEYFAEVKLHADVTAKVKVVVKAAS